MDYTKSYRMHLEISEFYFMLHLYKRNNPNVQRAPSDDWVVQPEVK